MLAMFTILLVCQLIGEVIVVFFEIPFPGPVIGMAILFVLLMVRGDLLSRIKQVSDSLLSHLSLMFVPAGVGVILHAHLLKSEFVAISVSLLVSTLVTLVLTAWVVQKLVREQSEL